MELLENRLTPSGAGHHAPVALDNTVATLEDTSYSFQRSDFNFSDPYDGPADNFLAVKVLNLPAAGLLKLNGQDVVPNQSISVADIAAGLFQLVPGADENGSASSSWSFAVQDDGGGYYGWPDTSASHTMTVDVTAVNDAPSFTASDPPAVDMFADPVSIAKWASFSPGGGPDETSQTPTYLVTNVSNPDLFSELPVIAPDGTLTYKVADHMNGTSTFDVQAQDDGGPENNGCNVSAVARFTVLIQPQVAPYLVNTTADTRDANVGDGLARDADGNTSLRAAIEEGNASGVRLTINFNLPGNSTINLDRMLGALPTLDRNFVINGPTGGNLIGANQLTIDAGNNFRVIAIGPFREVDIGNLTISNGRAPGNEAGGGIQNGGTFLSLVNVTLDHNQARTGGGIANLGGTLAIWGGFLHSNTATLFGGAISNNGTAWVQFGTQIDGNNALTGGGIQNGPNGQLTVDTGSQVRTNHASQSGGGIANWGSLTIEDAFVWFNDAANLGGGIYNAIGVGAATATLTNVSVENNQVTDPTNGRGAGIYLGGGTVTLVSGCTIALNICAVQGGGNGVCLWAPSTFNSNLGDNTVTNDVVTDPDLLL